MIYERTEHRKERIVTEKASIRTPLKSSSMLKKLSKEEHVIPEMPTSRPPNLSHYPISVLPHLVGMCPTAHPLVNYRASWKSWAGATRCRA